MVKYFEENKYFKVIETEIDTYAVADKNGKVFTTDAKRYLISNQGDYIKVENNKRKWTLYDKKGRSMPGAQEVDFIRLCPDYSYNVSTYYADNDGYGEEKITHYDNGATTRRICEKTLVTLGVVAALGLCVMGIKGCANHMEEKKEADNKLDATYIGSVPKRGYEKVYFNTDKNPETAEFEAEIYTDKEAAIYLNMQKGEKKKIGEWRAKGLGLYRIAAESQKTNN